MSLHKIGNANGISLKMGRQWYFEDFFPCKFNQAIILLNAQRNSLLAESVKKGIKSFEYKIPSLTYFHTAYTYTSNKRPLSLSYEKIIFQIQIIKIGNKKMHCTALLPIQIQAV